MKMMVVTTSCNLTSFFLGISFNSKLGDFWVVLAINQTEWSKATRKNINIQISFFLKQNSNSLTHTTTYYCLVFWILFYHKIAGILSKPHPTFYRPRPIPCWSNSKFLEGKKIFKKNHDVKLILPDLSVLNAWCEYYSSMNGCEISSLF